MSKDPKSTYYDEGGIETLEYIRAKLLSSEYQGYLRGNILKYASRLPYKGTPDRDAEKIAYYANELVQSLRETTAAYPRS